MTTDAELKPPPLIEQAIADFLGPRCRDFDADCYTCQAWKEYDELRDRRPLPSSGDLEVREALEPFAKIMDEVDRCLAASIKVDSLEGAWEHIHRDVLPIKEQALIQIDIAHLRRARSVLASLQEGGDRGGDGWKLVPIEPTKEMLRAGDYEHHEDDVGYLTLDIYRAMISASPARPGGVGSRDDVIEECANALEAEARRLREKHSYNDIEDGWHRDNFARAKGVDMSASLLRALKSPTSTGD